jgi:hypothetical protein
VGNVALPMRRKPMRKILINPRFKISMELLAKVMVGRM